MRKGAESLNKSRMMVILFFSAFTIILIASIPAFSRPNQTRPCIDCHAYPPTQIDVTADKTAVITYPSRNFTVTASYTGGANDGTTANQIAWPDEAADNTLFGFDPQYSVITTSPTDSLTSTITTPTTTGNYTVEVYAASGSTKDISKETDYEVIAVTVTIPGDIDGDGDVDRYDFWDFLDAYGSIEGEITYDHLADLQGDATGSQPDGDVDRYDFWAFLDNYGSHI